VTSQGYPIQDGLASPAGTVTVSIAKDGTVTAEKFDGTTSTVGKIRLSLFPNPSGLKALGGNLFLATEAAGSEVQAVPGRDGGGEILQFFLEKSNVEVVNELVSLIVAQRAYEMNSRAIKAGDEMMSVVNQMLG
jgi:flagellar basal-body rod protein FlgG